MGKVEKNIRHLRLINSLLLRLVTAKQLLCVGYKEIEEQGHICIGKARERACKQEELF